MNPGINIILPLVYDPSDGPYKTTKTLLEAIRQNMRMLFFTRKGERVMDINFGIGIRQFLFENITQALVNDIREVIYTQVATYLKYVQIVQLSVSTDDRNTLYISMNYRIPGVTNGSTFDLTVKD